MKDLFSHTGMPKATYMYWQKRFDRENPDQEIEEKIVDIRKEHKDYGYRRIFGELRNQGYSINKKKVQRIVQKLGLQVVSYTRKNRKYSSYRGRVVLLLRTGFTDVLAHIYLIRKSLQILVSSNTMKLMRKAV